MQISLRSGKESDLESVEKLFASARKRLADAGIGQWQGDYPNSLDFKNDVRENRAVVCEYDGKIVASAAVYIGTEKTYDKIFGGSWKTDALKYGIIHRTVTASSFLRTGLASLIFDFAEKLCKENSVISIRCDTHRDNIPMNSLLIKKGFSECGTIFVSDGTERKAYEKIIRI